MEPHVDDRTLLEQLKQDNRVAFDTIYKRYWEKLYAITYRRTRHTQATEDIVQEVFINLWISRHRTEIAILQSYLAMAVLYGTTRYLHRQRREKTDDLEAVQELAVYTNATHILENKNMLQLLQNEANKLPTQCRLIFRYSREQDMSIREIADTLQISTSTVNNQLTKALGRLRQSLKTVSATIFFW